MQAPEAFAKSVVVSSTDGGRFAVIGTVQMCSPQAWKVKRYRQETMLVLGDWLRK